MVKASSESFHLGVDASVLNTRRTGIGNYVHELLSRMVALTKWQFSLYSNQDIVFPDNNRVRKIVHRPYRKGPAWLNTQLLPQLYRDKLDCFWGGNGYLPLTLPVKTKTIVTIHDLVYLHAGHTMPTISRLSRRFLQPLAAKYADCLICVSKATASDVLHHYQCATQAVIYPQISPDYCSATASDIAKVKAHFDLPNSYILVLGTLEPRKNLLALVQAYAEVKQVHANLPLLVIAGGKGWLDGELPELIARFEEQKIVKKLGFVAQEYMHALYGGAELFVFPSIHEGYGMPVTEAQLCGTPTLISDIPSLKEAGGEITATFTPTVQGISKALDQYMECKLPLVCRLPNDIPNDPMQAALEMINQIIAIK